MIVHLQNFTCISLSQTRKKERTALIQALKGKFNTNDQHAEVGAGTQQWHGDQIQSGIECLHL